MSLEMQRPAWNLLTGTLLRYILLFLNIVIGIFLMPFTMHHLGKADYGLWMLAASLTAYLQLLDLGYGNGLVRQVAQADARGDEDAVNVILSTFFVVYSVIGVVALSVVAGLALVVLPRFPNLTPSDVLTAQWVLAILGARIALAFPMVVFGAVTTARQQFVVTGSIAIVVALLQGAATYLVLRAGYGLVTLVTVTTALGIASYAAYWAAARAAFPAMRLSVFRFSPRQVREVTAFSVYLFLISIAIHVSLNADNLVIGAYLGTSAVAVYTVAMRLADYQRQLCDQFSGFLFPLAVRFDASGDASALRATLLDGTRIALGLVGGVTLCLLAFGRQLIAAWMGPGFAESVAPLYVLALAGIVMVGQGPAGTILLTTGRQRLVAIISIVDITINVVLSIVLVSRYGLTGVAIGTALPYVVLNVLVLVPIACRTVGVSVREFARSVVTPTAVALLPAAAAAALFRTASTPASFAAIIGQGAAVALVYLAAFCVLGLGSVDRERYAGFVRRSALALRRPGVAIS